MFADSLCITYVTEESEKKKQERLEQCLRAVFPIIYWQYDSGSRLRKALFLSIFLNMYRTFVRANIAGNFPFVFVKRTPAFDNNEHTIRSAQSLEIN